MSDQSAGIHWSFWIIGVLALIWNGMGAMNFFMQLNPESIAKFPESHRNVIENRPPWATAAFAISVFGGTLGCLLLLLKRSAAYVVFVVSLIAILATMAHAFSVAGSPFQSGIFDLVFSVIGPVVVAVFLVWYSKYAGNRQWIT